MAYPPSQIIDGCGRTGGANPEALIFVVTMDQC
jgi:hypothetical protein